MAAVSLDWALVPAAALTPTPTLAPAPTLTPTQELEPTPVLAWFQVSGDGSGDENFPSLVRLRHHLNQQLREYNKAILAGQETFFDEIEENDNLGATQDLETDLEHAKVSFQNKKLALKRTQIMDVLRNKLEQDDEDSCWMLKKMSRILLLSWTIMNYQQQVHQREQQLTDIKRKRLSLKKYGGEKVRHIHTPTKRRKKKQAYVNVAEKETMLDKLEKERQIITIIQNVFQNVIIGSRVNWAEDPSLKEMVLQFEKNVLFQ